MLIECSHAKPPSFGNLDTNRLVKEQTKGSLLVQSGESWSMSLGALALGWARTIFKVGFSKVLSRHTAQRLNLAPLKSCSVRSLCQNQRFVQVAILELQEPIGLPVASLRLQTLNSTLREPTPSIRTIIFIC